MPPSNPIQRSHQVSDPPTLSVTSSVNEMHAFTASYFVIQISSVVRKIYKKKDIDITRYKRADSSSVIGFLFFSSVF